MADSTATRPFAAFEWMIAMRYLRAKRKEAFVSVISVISLVGIALGVATLIIVMSVMGGFRHQIIKSLLGFNGHVMVQAVGQPLAAYNAVTDRLRHVPGVTWAAPIIDGQVMATAYGRNTGVLVRAMRASDLKSLTAVSSTLSKGALENFSGDGVILGSGVAAKLGLHVGDSVTLISPEGDETPFGTTLRNKAYIVAGTFNVGNAIYDANALFMPLDEGQAFFGYDGAVNTISVMVSDPDKDYAMIPAIAQAAGRGTRIQPWQDINRAYLDVIDVERNVMGLILSLIILVAALNIISGLYMLVSDKSADIAVLRTMGASRGAIMRVFLIAGMSVGVSGTLVGLVLGIVFCLNINSILDSLRFLTGINLFDSTFYFLSRLPADLDSGEVTFVVVLALVFSFIATLYPSWRAARLDPVEALRYE
jgi:lipoprotein-releasing system permease protein